ncbi:kinase-like protein, partial [Lophium mytilinum]
EEIVGRGALACVSKFRLDSGQPIALKECIIPQQHRENPLKRCKHGMSLVREFQALSRLRHRHIMACFGLLLDSRHIGLMMPIGRGTLRELLENQLPASTPTNSVEHLGCLASAVAAIHDKEVCHGDLKPENILIMQDDRWCIADFGSCTIASIPDYGSSMAFTRRYAAPEVISHQSSTSRASDMFSLGCVFLETTM